MFYTGERAIPFNASVGKHVMNAHIQRYAFAVQYCWQKEVADLACGTGYGSHILSLVAKSVKGVDIDPQAVDYAIACFGHTDNLMFEQADMTKGVPVAEIYTAFECLEHVENFQGVLGLVAGRSLIWSLPINDDSRFHKRVFTLDDIYNVMPFDEIYYQSSRGVIAHENLANFMPAYVVGVSL